jgi:hypothetical protein
MREQPERDERGKGIYNIIKKNIYILRATNTETQICAETLKQQRNKINTIHFTSIFTHGDQMDWWAEYCSVLE